MTYLVVFYLKTALHKIWPQFQKNSKDTVPGDIEVLKTSKILSHLFAVLAFVTMPTATKSQFTKCARFRTELYLSIYR